MSYRDESEALRARIHVLENELADAKLRIAELSQGPTLDASLSAVRAPDDASGSTSSLWLAAPSQLALERELFVTVSPATVARLEAHFVRERPRGTARRGEQAFSFRDGTLRFSISPIGEGRSRVRMDVDNSAIGAIPPIFAIFGAIVALPIIGSTLGPLALLLALPVTWLLGVMVLRRFFGWRVHTYRANNTKLFESAVAIATREAARARVEPHETSRLDDDDEEDEAQEDEATVRRS